MITVHMVVMVTVAMVMCIDVAKKHGHLVSAQTSVTESAEQGASKVLHTWGVCVCAGAGMGGRIAAVDVNDV